MLTVTFRDTEESRVMSEHTRPSSDLHQWKVTHTHSSMISGSTNISVHNRFKTPTHIYTISRYMYAWYYSRGLILRIT